MQIRLSGFFLFVCCFFPYSSNLTALCTSGFHWKSEIFIPCPSSGMVKRERLRLSWWEGSRRKDNIGVFKVTWTGMLRSPPSFFFLIKKIFLHSYFLRWIFCHAHWKANTLCSYILDFILLISFLNKMKQVWISGSEFCDEIFAVFVMCAHHVCFPMVADSWQDAH